MFRARLLFILPLVVTVSGQNTVGYYGTSNIRDQRPHPGPLYRPRPILQARPIAHPIPIQTAPAPQHAVETPALPPPVAPPAAPVATLPVQTGYRPLRPIIRPQPLRPGSYFTQPAPPPVTVAPQPAVEIVPQPQVTLPSLPVAIPIATEVLPIETAPVAAPVETAAVITSDPVPVAVEPVPTAVVEAFTESVPNVPEYQPVSIEPEPTAVPAAIKPVQVPSVPEAVPNIILQPANVIAPQPVVEPVHQKPLVPIISELPIPVAVQEPPATPEIPQELVPNPQPEIQHMPAVPVLPTINPIPIQPPVVESQPPPQLIPTVILQEDPVPVQPQPVVNLQPGAGIQLPPLLPKPKPIRQPAFGRHPLGPPVLLTTPRPTHAVYFPTSLAPQTVQTARTTSYPIVPSTTARPLTNPPTLTYPSTTSYPLVPFTKPSPVYSTPSKGIGSLKSDFKCREGDGYYSVANECDSYIECKNNVAMKYWCLDGLHFNSAANRHEYPCAYPSEVQCSAGAAIQSPNPTEYCPRQYGYFAVSDGDCSKFISCQEGLATVMDCPAGLAFNPQISSCDWPANVPQCNPNVFNDFVCPAAAVNEYGEESDIIYNYRYGQDCALYIACQRGHPRLLSCERGLFFDDKSQSCINEDYVTDCTIATPYQLSDISNT